MKLDYKAWPRRRMFVNKPCPRCLQILESVLKGISKKVFPRQSAIKSRSPGLHFTAPVKGLTLVQHHSLGSRDVLLSLFSSFVESSPLDIVLLQDPTVYYGSLLSYAGVKSFFPPVPKLRKACLISLSFCKRYALLPSFDPYSDDVMLFGCLYSTWLF